MAQVEEIAAALQVAPERIEQVYSASRSWGQPGLARATSRNAC